jgi:hypothetical protein
MDRPVEYQGLAARLFVRDPYPDHPLKYGNAPYQINDDLFAYNYRYEKPSAYIGLELSML